MIVKMTAKEAYLRFWTQVFNLKDRARRKEFWIPNIIHFLLYFIVYLLVLLYYKVENNMIYMTANVIVNAILIVPTFAVTFRRLQDLNIRGWYVLLIPILYVPTDLPPNVLNVNMQIIGEVIHFFTLAALLILVTLDGTEGPNRYGHDPKEEIDEFNPRKY